MYRLILPLLLLVSFSLSDKRNSEIPSNSPRISVVKVKIDLVNFERKNQSINGNQHLYLLLSDSPSQFSVASADLALRDDGSNETDWYSADTDTRGG